MPQYEYQVVCMRPVRPWLMPWASQQVRDSLDLEKTLNRLADEGWEVLSSGTTSAGGFLFFFPMSTVILRREKGSPKGP